MGTASLIAARLLFCMEVSTGTAIFIPRGNNDIMKE